MGNNLRVELQSLGRNLTFASKSGSGHWHMMDTKEEIGGNNAATTPMEMLLEALGGCTGMDTLSILRKKRTPFSRLDIHIDSERAEEHPKVYTKINLRFTLYSNGGEKALRDLQRAAMLSNDKYCSISAMLRSTTEITLETEIVDE
jgi:putative redox protein